MMSSHLTDRVEPANLKAFLPFLQGTCFILIETTRFAATSLLIALGLPLALFLFVAGWDLHGLFTQLGNLSDRYLEADGLRRTLFSQDLKICFLIIAGAVTLFRMPRFLQRLAADLDTDLSKEPSRG
ncbi:hypothetical protein GRI44_13315 [Altererythrobacter confluentis]|uniref:Conjugative transfer protein n=1 Tax=Allopontixanthobacter confluentis TaxID=1849021 RepID=A0A6L7GIH1_9SPHN|nr:hypothetical protein [Allopontixanthobacter confluentis]MXP15729.1 hypothetical protein [Allopontixanthobacter confluentis]